MVLESEKAKANRQARCQNDEKLTCCYLCQSKPECAMSCKFLGNVGYESIQVEPEKTETQRKIDTDKKSERSKRKTA